MSETYRRQSSRMPPASSDDGTGRTFGKWSVAFGLFVALLALLTSLQLFQVTAEGASKRTLRRSVAALTEIDPLLDRKYEDLRRNADAVAAEDVLTLPDFPIRVPLPAAQVRTVSKDQFRETLLDRSSDAMYEDGAAALSDPQSGGSVAGRFSVSGIMRHGLGFLRHRNHDILAVITFALAAICIALAGVLALTCRGFGRLGSVGGVVLAAAIPVLVGGIGARFYMRIAADEDTEFVQRQFLDIGQGLAWIPIRDGAAFTVLGLSFLLVAIAGAMWTDRIVTE